MASKVSSRVRLGAYDLDLRAGELLCGQTRVVLQEQPLQILLMLIEARGKVVARDEIQKRLWPNDTVVEFDHSIRTAINKLRKALNDSPDRSAYIQTVARRGYRLMVPVESVEDASSAESGNSMGFRAASVTKAKVEVGNLTAKVVSHYRVLELIGGGGMGMVYKAEDLKLGRRVALKFLPEELASDPLALQRFEREARTASSLNHPNICYVHEFGEHEGQPYLAMELLEGETLRDRLAAAAGSAQKVSLEELLRIGLQVCDGLEAAHEQGIIHRDIKPANIFLTNKGVVKILDFGLAKLVEAPEVAPAEQAFSLASAPAPLSLPGGVQAGEGLNPAGSDTKESLEGGLEGPLHAPTTPVEHTLTRTGVAMGTAGYMSPEQVRGEQLDARTDLFSLGLVLYEMATGQRAFTGQTAAILRDAILHSTPPPVRELSSGIPVRLIATINNALEKDREQRYQSAAEMRTALAQVRLAPPLRRWRIPVAVAVVLAALVAAGYQWRQRHPAAKLTASDTVVLTDFADHTTDPVFGDALKVALSIDLEQTPFLNILAPEKIRGTLKSMGRPEDDRLTPELAREVCLRTHSKALLESSISDLGNQYEIDLKSVDCKTGNTLADSTATAAGRSEIVQRLGDAGHKLRQNLGEPASSLRQFNTPLESAASPSLDALHEYATGVTTYGTVQAISHFKRAAELDPSFALAYLSLGRCYTNVFEDSQASEVLTKAFQLQDRASLRDRLDIEAMYYWTVAGDAEKAVSAFVQAGQNFPRWGRPRNTLGSVFKLLGQFEKAVAVERDVVRLTPEIMAPYSNLSESYVDLNRLEDAKPVLQDEALRAPDNESRHWLSYRIAFLQNNPEGMNKEIQWATRKAGTEDIFLKERSQTEAYYGHLHKSLELLREAEDSAAQAGMHERSNEWKSVEALRVAKVGETSKALLLAREVMAESLSPRAMERAALVFARAGDEVQALALVQQLSRQFPRSTLVQRCELPKIRAEIYLHQHRPNLAVDELRDTVPYELTATEDQFPLEPAYIRGEAYLQAGQAQQAATEFRKLLQHWGLVANSINGPLARLQLARAQARMGDNTAALRSYRDFLTLWKDADSDIPIYREAKTEYAKLQ